MSAPRPASRKPAARRRAAGVTRPARAQPFAFRQFVRFGDVDHAGIVYYPRFFHYFHVAFEELFRQRLGEAYAKTFNQRRLGFPVVALQALFHRPLRFGDEISVEVGVERLGTSSIDFLYVVRGVDRGAVAYAQGKLTVVCTDTRRFRPRPIPHDLRRKLQLVALGPDDGAR